MTLIWCYLLNIFAKLLGGREGGRGREGERAGGREGEGGREEWREFSPI